MKRMKSWALGALSLCLLGGGMCVEAQEAGAEEYTVGVVVYNPDSAEMEMFMDYYQNYIQAGFPVKFYFSGLTTSAEGENAFIESMKAMGADGIISFLGMDVQSTVALCEENELYYVLSSGSISDQDYEAVKDNPWFLGTVGADVDAAYETGRDMAEYFLGQDAKSFLIMTGGACEGEYALHTARTKGMLDVLEEKAGLVLEEKDSDAQAIVSRNTTLTSEDGAVTVTLCPDYTEGGEGLANLDAAFDAGNYDTVMSAFHVSTYLDRITAKEKEQNANIMVGAIDSFTETNFEIFQQRDAMGNCPIDYVQGKYGAMAGPAFAMLYNAMSGHPEANTADGEAPRLYQEFWTARTEAEYVELYGYTTGIYENAYSCSDLMDVIKVFNDEATPEKLKELAEASDVESVKARILP